MKVVLSGGTGYIGSEVLTHCLNHPSITSVLFLTRRAPEKDIAENPKVKVIIVKDFTSYDEPIIKELKTADAAIWCIGTYNGDEVNTGNVMRWMVVDEHKLRKRIFADGRDGGSLLSKFDRNNGIVLIHPCQECLRSAPMK